MNNDTDILDQPEEVAPTIDKSLYVVLFFIVLITIGCQLQAIHASNVLRNLMTTHPDAMRPVFDPVSLRGLAKVLGIVAILFSLIILNKSKWKFPESFTLWVILLSPFFIFLIDWFFLKNI